METRQANQDLQFQAEDFPQALVLDINQGQSLFEDGDAFDGFAYLLLHGYVDVSIRAFDGSETMLYRLKETTLLGELGFMGGLMRTATVTAATPCRLLRISEQDWQQASCQADFSAKLQHSLCQRFLHTHRVVRRLGQGKVLHRLGVYLLDLPQWTDSQEDIIEVRLPTHAVLASMLGCTRERVTRLLKMLGSTGALEKLPGQGRVRIFRDKLNQVLQSEA